VADRHAGRHDARAVRNATVLSALVRLLRADNPGPYTLEGTNTYLVGERAPVVIDPGPDDLAHLEAVLAEAGEVSLVVLTHTHPDHAAGAERFAAMARAPLAAFRSGVCGGASTIADGDAIAAPGVEMRALHTPGHASDHLCFHLPAENVLFSGDHVLGRGTSVIAYPDGNLTDYLASLHKARAVGAQRIFPGHGPTVEDPAGVLDGYIAHRAERQEQIREALRAGARTVDDIVTVVYPGLDAALRGAAGSSVRAHLDKLVGDGEAVYDDHGTWVPA
jgi:glyoxylase-like metal-dependent hydrolase (beta-lactamase superfamily II)